MRPRKRVAVVGYDMGRTGDEALIDALQLLKTGALEHVHIVHVIAPKLIFDEPDRGIIEAEDRALQLAPAEIEQRVDELCACMGVQPAPATVRGHARLGDPATTLLQACVDYEADLLIVGTHGRRGLDRWMVGSVAEHLVRYAKCPVLVARPIDYRGVDKTELPDPPYPPGEEPPPRHDDDLPTHGLTTLDSWSPSDNGPTGFRIV